LEALSLLSLANMQNLSPVAKVCKQKCLRRKHVESGSLAIEINFLL
jgi:hypothetical protein